MSESSVRYLGSRELHRELPRILEELNDRNSRLILTIHAKPKAVMLGAEAFAHLVRQVCDLDQKLGEELSSLMQSESGKVSTEKLRNQMTESSNGSHGSKKNEKSRRKSRMKPKN